MKKGVIFMDFDFSSIIITLDYLIRKVMAILDSLMLTFGGSSTTETTEAETTTEAAIVE